MKIPGFTAEASLYKSGECCFVNGMQTALKNDREILPQGCYYYQGQWICRSPLPDPWGRRPPLELRLRHAISGQEISAFR